MAPPPKPCPLAQPPHRWWWVVGALAFLLRVGAAWLMGAFHHPQLYEYEEIARSLLAGRGFLYHHIGGVPYHAFVEPLYPWICAVVYALAGGSTAALLLVQMAAGAGGAVLIAFIGERIFGDWRAGLVGGLMAAVHPGLIIYAGTKAHPLTFDVLCFSLLLWQWLRLAGERTLRRSLWTGLVLGLTWLERPTALVFWPVGALWLLWTSPRGERLASLRCVGLVSVCALLVIAPWSVRNWRLYHRPVLIRTTNWEVFWRGNNPLATGHSYVNADRTVLETLPPEALAALRRLPDEEAQSRWFRDRALAFVREHPRRVIGLTLRKWYYFWWCAPQSGTLYPATWLRTYMLWYASTFGLALLGIGTLWRRGTMAQRQATVFIVALLAGFSFLQSWYYVEGRHRWAVEPFLLLFTGWQCLRLWQRWRRQVIQTLPREHLMAVS